MKKVLFFLLLLPHLAFASFTPTGSYYTITRGTAVLLQSTLATSVLNACTLVQGDPMHNSMAVLGFIVTTTYLNNPSQCSWSGVGGGPLTSSSVTFGSCPANATLAGGSCSCNSGFVQSGTPAACIVRAGSPNGATAPIPPGGNGLVFAASAVALGMLAGLGAVMAVPLLTVVALGSAAVASGLIAAPLLFNAPTTSTNAFSSAGSPLAVSLSPSASNTAGSSGSMGAIGVNLDGQFVPAGGGTFSGGASSAGGWMAGSVAGEYTYQAHSTGSVAAPVVAVISDGGFTYRATTASDTDYLTKASVVARLFTDGSLSMTDARQVPVVTFQGKTTTADVAVTTAYASDGTKVANSTVSTIGSTLGNGDPANGGAGLAITGAGFGAQGTSSGSGNSSGGVVKIDESGTPGTVSSDIHKSKSEDFLAVGQGNQSTMAGNSDKGFFTGWSAFFSAPPVVECSPYTLPRDMGSIDPCSVVNGVRAIMAYLWALAGLFLVVRMVRQVR